jgi:hypothetical protein
MVDVGDEVRLVLSSKYLRKKDGVYNFTSIRFHILLQREKELSLNFIQNASKLTLKLSMVSNIRVVTSEGPRDRILVPRNIGIKHIYLWFNMTYFLI